MLTRDSWTLFRVSGVPVRIHFTWIFVAVYLSILFAGQFTALARAADVGAGQLLLPPWAWGILLTLALFVCVLLHELAHVAVARRGGAQVRAVTLMMLGGVSEIGDVERPELERKMAIAGPILSLLLAVVFFGLFRLSRSGPPDVHFGLFYLAQVNLVIGVFNLLPAFPMDGGRVFRSLLVRRFGRLRATQIAATVGKIVAAGLVVIGLLGGGWWLALIGLFLFIGGDAEYRSLQARAALRGLQVADLFTRQMALVGAGASLAEAARQMVAARSPVCFVFADGRVAGVVSAEQLARIRVRERAAVSVAELMRPVPVVRTDADLPSVLKQMEEAGVEAAAVIDASGRLAGTLSTDEIARGLQLHELTTA